MRKPIENYLPTNTYDTLIQAHIPLHVREQIRIFKKKRHLNWDEVVTAGLSLLLDEVAFQTKKGKQ